MSRTVTAAASAVPSLCLHRHRPHTLSQLNRFPGPARYFQPASQLNDLSGILRGW